MDTEHRVAAEFGIDPAQARKALARHRETGRPLDEIVAELRPLPVGEPTPAAGSVKNFGKYEILERLGQGGGGMVFRVRNPGLRRIEALKILRTEGEAGVEEHARFEREARVLGQLHHPNIVPVYEVGTIDGQAYYTMEFLPGDNVADIIKRMGSLPPRAAMLIGREAARALSAAHQRGIIHRDVKPHNIMICPQADRETEPDQQSTLRLSGGAASRFRVVLTDFGLARVVGEQSLTADVGSIAGTLSYMSPEQINAERKRINERSDLFSLGSSLYEMLTGKVPFQADSVLELQVAITCKDPKPLHELRPGLSKDVETIVTKCLEKDPRRRYGGAEDLADDIERYLRGEVIRARLASLLYRIYRWTRRRAAIVVPAAAAVATAVLLAFFMAVLPAIRNRANDRKALRSALDQKRAAEREFRDLLERGAYDDAIALAAPLWGKRPPLPDLKNPRLAHEPRYAELLASYRFELAAAYLRRGRRRVEKGDLTGYLDLSQAYQTALATADDGIGREALFQWAADLERTGDPGRALALYRLCESRFPPTSESVARLARSLQRSGLLEEAAAQWRRLQDDPTFGSEGRQAWGLLSRLLPRRQFPIGRGRIVVDDVDGDGTCEILRLTGDGAFTVYRITAGGITELGRLQLPYATDHWAVRLFDLDGDGRREILIGTGEPGDKKGCIYVVQWTAGGPVLAATDDSPESFCNDFSIADLDGDGLPELIAATGYYDRSLRFFRYRKEGLTPLGKMPLGSDPEFVAPGDWGARGVREMLVHLGPWDQEHGYRALLLAMDEGGKWRVAARGEDRFHATEWLRIGEHEFILAAYRVLKETMKMPRLASAGLYRLEVRDGAISKLRRLLGPWPDEVDPSSIARFDLRGESYAAVGVGSRIHIVPLGEGQPISFESLRKQAFYLTAGDVDGDHDRELVFMNGDLLEVWGMGDPESAVESGAKAAVEGVSRKSAGEDLLDARFYGEAEESFRRALSEHPQDARARFGLGVALAAQGKYGPAVQEFAAAARDPALAVDAGLRRAHACQSARNWSGMVEAISILDVTPGLDPFAAEQVARWKEWVMSAAAIQPRVSVAAWKPGLPLLCENPFEAGVAREGLVVWDNADRPSATGLALLYDGGPMRLKIRFRFQDPQWETGIRIGIHYAGAIGRPKREGDDHGTLFEIYYGGEGLSESPIRILQWLMTDRPGSQMREIFQSGDRPLDAGREYLLEFEYIPGLDRVFVALSDDAGRSVVEGRSFTVPFRFDPGLCSVGNVRESIQTKGQPNYRTPFLIRSVEIEAATPATRVARPEVSSARELLLLANGDLVLGALESAKAGYRDAIERAELERNDYVRWRAHLFRALVHLRQGDPDAARKDVQIARKIQGEEVVKLLEVASDTLTAQERETLTAAAKEF